MKKVGGLGGRGQGKQGGQGQGGQGKGGQWQGQHFSDLIEYWFCSVLVQVWYISFVTIHMFFCTFYTQKYFYYAVIAEGRAVV